MSRAFRFVLRWLGRIGIAIAVTLVVLWFALPPAIDPRSGEADPLLGVRRPVMKALYALGIPHPIDGPDDWMPSELVQGSWPGPGSARSIESRHVTLRSEPVYRGGVWRVGRRVAIRIERTGPTPDPVVDLVLWSETGDVRTELARGGPATTDAATGVRRVEVRGFVDADAERFGWVETYKDGRRYDGESWGR